MKVDSCHFLGVRSPEMLLYWDKKDYLLTNIVRVATLFFSHNIKVFFEKAATFVQSFFSSKPKIEKKPAMDQEGEAPPVIEEEVEEKPRTITPFLGVAMGLGGGLLWRLAQGISLSEKAVNCRAVSSKMSLPLINRIKQAELKHFALFSAALPFTYQMVQSVRKEPPDLSLIERIKRGVKKQVSLPGFVRLSLLMGLSLSHPLYSYRLGLTQKGGFDSSGHVMLKTALAAVMGGALEGLSGQNRQMGLVAGSIYIATDALFLANTVRFCHTTSEALAGLAWGGGIVALSHLGSGTCEKMF